MRFFHLQTLALVATSLASLVHAQAEVEGEKTKATIALVGEMERFSIGQDGYCGKRTEIDNPSSVSFQIPGGKDTWFSARTRFRTQMATYTCDGDYSFKPEAATFTSFDTRFRTTCANWSCTRAFPVEFPSELRSTWRRAALASLSDA